MTLAQNSFNIPCPPSLAPSRGSPLATAPTARGGARPYRATPTRSRPLPTKCLAAPSAPADELSGHVVDVSLGRAAAGFECAGVPRTSPISRPSLGHLSATSRLHLAASSLLSVLPRRTRLPTRLRTCHGRVLDTSVARRAAQDAPLPVHRRLGEGGAQDEPLDRGEAPRRGAVADH